VVGLGNPGSEFVGSRHNAGSEVVALLAERHAGRLKAEKGLRAQVGAVRIGDHPVLLAVPQTFMNESGQAVAPLVRRAGIDQPRHAEQPDPRGGPAADRSAPGGLASRLIIVHDELDLPSGRVKVKSGGGNAGNNGLRSIESHLHTNEYLRVRIGIGKPPGREAGAAHVLKRPGAAERALIAVAIEEAADAVETIVTDGIAAAMNRVNTSD
jgi:PTH1 family peptidyl-tRNA hydrolase